MSNDVAINIMAPSELAVEALTKFNEVQVAYLPKNIKLNKKLFYAYLLQQGLANYSDKSLEKFIKQYE